MPYVEERFRAGGDAVDELNAGYDRRTAGLSLDDVRGRAAETHRRLVDAVAAITDEEWRSKAPYEAERRDRLGNLLGSITGAPKRPFGHALAHLPDLEEFAKRPGPGAG